jgi:CubicO group peptidase (beta-lactamase class C family)
MALIKLLLSTSLFLAGLDTVHAACEPEISFPVPNYGKHTLREPLSDITKNLDSLINAGDFAKTSFSLEISSSSKTLYTKYHTDKSLGGSPINGSSVYRIASGTKLFTALGILKQEALGKLNLDDEVTKYVSSLSNGSSKISWKGITIRSLLAHAGGLPDNCEYLPGGACTHSNIN